MNVIAIIQARMGSTRLPGKVLLPLGDKTVLEHVITRTAQSKLLDEVFVATTIEKKDLKILNFVSSLGFRVFAGSVHDVLDRYFQLAKLIKPKHIVRITADCPMIDPDVIDKIISTHLESDVDYTGINTTFPDGLDVEIFTFEALKDAWKNAKLSSEREHVTPYIVKNDKFKKEVVSFKKDLSHYRWTIDNPEDYEFLKVVFENVYKKKKDFRTKDVLEFLEKNPDVMKINSHIVRNEGYLKSLREDKELSLDYLGE